jgi:hypothetical protein
MNIKETIMYEINACGARSFNHLTGYVVEQCLEVMGKNGMEIECMREKTVR